METNHQVIEVVVKSFCDGSTKIDLATILWWYMMKTPQAKMLEQFLMDIFPKLKESEDGHKS